MATSAAGARTLELTESGLLPDALLRAGIRRLLRARLADIRADDVERSAAARSAFVEAMDVAAIAPQPERANEQHYEVPAAFFGAVLGAERKYSCCYWEPETPGLDTAEANALRITCERAGIVDGMRVLDLGCGWGSLSLWIAERYPRCRIVAVSNSQSQHDYIVDVCRQRRLGNLEVRVGDMNDFDPGQRFDRIVSVEMFEHMRNYRRLFARIAGWLAPGGRFFMHIFCHRSTPYEFVDRGAADWMSRHFFAGGSMPSSDLPVVFQDDLRFLERWHWSGTHYAKTANAWLARMDRSRDVLMPILRDAYGDARAHTWFVRWRIFFMACAELFDYANGQEWFVGHYLFERRRAADPAG